MSFTKLISPVVGLVLLTCNFQLSAQPESTLNVEAVKASQRLLMDIKSIINGRLVAVGERGHILISDDNGKSWLQKLIPSEVLLTKLFFIDNKNGWAIGHQQTILKTNNGGETWQVQHSSDNLDQPALFDIWFKNQQTGFAVGAYGLFLKTNDGGETWEEVFVGNLEDEEIGFPHFYSLAYDIKNEQVILAGEFGLLAASKNDGETWQKFDSPYQGSFFNVAVLEDGTLLAMGLRGHLFRSIDQGVSWTETQTGTISGLQELLVLSDKRILIVGSDGTQLISNDSGLSVDLVQRADRVHLANAVNLPNKKVLLVGISGVLETQLK